MSTKGRPYFDCNECPAFMDADCSIHECPVKSVWTKISPEKGNGSRRTGTAYRRYQTRKKRNDLMRILGYGFKPYVGHVNGSWIDGVWQQTGTYVKRSKSSEMRQFYKRYTNKKVRRCKEAFSKGNQYRKCFDYWWTLY